MGHGLKSMSMRQFVNKYVSEYPELLDLVAADDLSMQVASEAGGAQQQSRMVFPLHLPMHEVLDGLKSRRFLKGTIRSDRDNCLDCYVVVHSSDGVTRKSVQIKGIYVHFVVASLALQVTLFKFAMCFRCYEGEPRGGRRRGGNRAGGWSAHRS